VVQELEDVRLEVIERKEANRFCERLTGAGGSSLVMKSCGPVRRTRDPGAGDGQAYCRARWIHPFSPARVFGTASPVPSYPSHGGGADGRRRCGNRDAGALLQ